MGAYPGASARLVCGGSSSKRGIYPGIRPIEGVIEAPTLRRRNGSILATPGYDPATRLFLRPSVEVGAIPDRPSKDDAKRALDAILELVCDFPFKGDEHRAVWLASLFTVVALPRLKGPAPLFGFDGNCPGTGKSKLADLVAIIASGRRMPRSVWPSGHNADEEVRKRIASMRSRANDSRSWTTWTTHGGDRRACH